MAKYIGIKAILNEFKKRILLLAHPVHSLYMSTDQTSPEILFGGKWESLPAGCFVRNAGGDAGAVGQVQTEGLPNITGRTLGILGHDRFAVASGALSNTNDWMYSGYGAGYQGGGLYNSDYMRYIDFNAHNSNAIYGNSNHVTPYNVAVYMWWRTK